MFNHPNLPSNKLLYAPESIKRSLVLNVFLVGVVALFLAAARLYCQTRTLSARKSFAIGFISVLLAFCIVIPFAIYFRDIETNPIETYQYYLWAAGTFVLSIGAGVNCAVNSASQW